MSEKQFSQYEPAPRAQEEAPNTTTSHVLDAEKQRENARNGNPNGFARTTSGVGQSICCCCKDGMLTIYRR